MSRGGGKGKQSYTVGYWYGLGAHLALCHGPVDAVTEIRVGERVAWSGTFAEAAATELNLTLAKRFIRPYCPGNVRVNGLRYPGVITGEFSVSWATRNRQSQTAYLVLQTEGSITPEAGQTTTVRLFNENGALVKTLVGLTATGVTWSLAEEAADSGLSRINGRIRMEIEAERGGHVSWQKQVIEFDRAGYGLNYGKYYGGI